MHLGFERMFTDIITWVPATLLGSIVRVRRFSEKLAFQDESTKRDNDEYKRSHNITKLINNFTQ